MNREETQRLEGVPWWDPSGPMAALHTMNTLRVPLIKNTLLGVSPDDITTLDQVPHPLQGWSVLDIGCGAGILSEVCRDFPSQTFNLCSHTHTHWLILFLSPGLPCLLALPVKGA